MDYKSLRLTKAQRKRIWDCNVGVGVLAYKSGERTLREMEFFINRQNQMCYVGNGKPVEFEVERDSDGFEIGVTQISDKPEHPEIVCLCGSTRFSEAYREANLRETLAGRIVLTIGCDMRADADLFANRTEDERTEIKAGLDALHLQKIRMADSVLILNVGGYVGESTRREIQYALELGKAVRWLEPHMADEYQISNG